MHDALLADFRAGRKAALARAISIVENHRAGSDALLGALHPRLGRARRIGVTGPPGAGKSTITAGLARHYRGQGRTVGIVCVDPTSPFTGGALLGDRIRREDVALDPGVYIRSLATRGSLGGLSAATREVCDVLDAFGIDRILIETVGVGQSELEVARTADSSLVILVPESGDSIQTLKAGLMEIADVFTVNKADRPGADRLRTEIELMLGMRPGAAATESAGHHGVDLSRNNLARQVREAAARDDARWTPPVLRTIGIEDQGIVELADALDRHFQYLEASGQLRTRRRARLRERVVDVVEDKTRQRLWTDRDTTAWLEARLPQLETGEATPFEIADALLARSADLLSGRTT
ncbi:MAG TPA: methylmalonyl Co-A mutase-associated GTPase MeaB [Gemmatimonadaceae bacterium]|nr:methylmalonyl Co-A mutase-associated GTPase MeaB [Gemmatimonadaceae bacterium]